MLIEVLAAFLIVFGGGDIDEFPVVNDDVGAVVGQGVRIAEGTEEAADIALGTVELEGHGDLIVRVAVAVGVLLLERGQHVFKVDQGHGLFQSEAFEPGHVDHDVGRDGAVFAFIDIGRGVDVAVWRCAHLLDVRAALKESFQVRRVLLNQVVERQENTLGTIVDQVGSAQGELAEEAFRQVGVRAEDEVLFLIILSLLDLVPFNVDVGQLFHTLEQFHFIRIAVQRTDADDQLEGIAFG